MKIIYKTQDIAERVHSIAEAIKADYGDEEFVIIGILTGAFVFVADLIRAMPSLNCKVDFYRNPNDISWDTFAYSEQRVLYVDCVIETGETLIQFAMQSHRLVKSMDFCCLVDKTARRKIPFVVKYSGFQTSTEDFLVGYGLDRDGGKNYGGKMRGTPMIVSLQREED